MPMERSLTRPQTTNTDAFLKLAESRAQTLSSLSCNLGAMTQFALDAQDRLKSIVPNAMVGKKTSVAQSSGISVNQNPFLSARMPASGAHQNPPWKVELLSYFGPEIEQPPAPVDQNAAPLPEEGEMTFFERVTAKIREKEFSGNSQQPLVDLRLP